MPQNSTVKSALSTFSTSISHLKEFLNSSEDHLKNKDKELLLQIAPVLAPFIMQIRDNPNKHTPEKIKKIDDKTLHKMFGGEFKLDKSGSDSEGIAISFKNKELGEKFLQGLKKVGENPLKYLSDSSPSPKVDLLLKSTLTVLVSNAEYLISDLLRYKYRKWPESLNNSEAKFTFAELLKFNNLEEAREHILSRKVESVLRGRIEDCIKDFGPKFVDKMATHLPTHKIVEIFARRNLIIHNHGYINHQYIERVGEHLSPNLEQGKKIPVNRKYVDLAIDNIQIFFTLLALNLWLDSGGKVDDVAKEAMNFGFEFLSDDKWLQSRTVYSWVLTLKNLTEYDKHMSQINCFLTYKWNGEAPKIKSDLEKLDYSACENFLKMGYLLVHDSFAEAKKLVEICIKDEKLDPESLKTWPIFKEFRNSKEYSELKIHTKAPKQKRPQPMTPRKKTLEASSKKTKTTKKTTAKEI